VITTLAAADPDWAAENVERIFPAGDGRLRRSAWHLYLLFNGVWEGSFRLLVDQYRRGIEALADDIDEPVLGDVGRALVNHLMTAYRFEMADFDDGSGLIERLRALWEQRLHAVRNSGDENAGEELRGFAWWFASGKFDPAWSLAQLAAMVDAGGRIQPDHVVAEQLAALRDDHLPAVLRARSTS
jgi:hypothetical protein